MAGAVIEVKYFNTFILKKTLNGANAPLNTPLWNGSFGIPAAKGGYPTQPDTTQAENWAVEESRITGGYNNTSVDFGVRAYLVEDEPNAITRFNALIYSGVFNSRTGINDTNVFNVGQDITKSTDPANGSIQKLYAEDTNLIILQESKISRALIDKDAIYSAEGGGAVTSSNQVIGVIQPYAGKYGISTNPESFAIYGYNKYFADKNNNVILRLGGQGINEISNIGMRDYFRDELNSIDTTSNNGFIRGGYDIYNGNYVLSTQQDILVRGKASSTYNTVSFDETIQGWTSFFDYRPVQMFSLRKNFYTVSYNQDDNQNGALWRHYSSNVDRGTFYGSNFKSSVTFVFNPEPTRSKGFKTIGYEGSNGWEVNSIISDQTGAGINPTSSQWATTTDTSATIPSYLGGEYVVTTATGTTLAASVGTDVDLILPISGTIVPDATVQGIGVPGATTVVSYDTIAGTLECNDILGLTAGGVVLTINGQVLRADYNAVLGTTLPNLPRYHSGFYRKENSYVANLINNSAATEAEILFGQQMSGLKGYYVTVKMSTDSVTNVGGEKQLFSVSSEYITNNGY